MPITNATLARSLGSILRGASDDMAALVEGMWNPDFCSADATEKATEMANNMEFAVAALRAKIKG